MTGYQRPAIDRVRAMSKPDPSGCILWTGYLHERTGYAYVAVLIGGRRTRRGVHQVALEEKLGRDLERGEMALHTCDVRHCVNPKHLYAGDHDDNMRDRDERGRTPRGAQVGTAKLTPGLVSAIRRDRSGGMPYADLQSKYRVSAGTISNVVNRKSWKSVA